MPFTVVTLKKVPPALRGDLTKWMQEIATGVYVGNFNTRVRENLWKRICDAVGDGEATISYTCRNEIGYEFQTLNTERQVIDCDGIPLVLIPLKKSEEKATGYSTAYKLHKARKYTGPNKAAVKKEGDNPYVVIDIETTGLNESKDQIIEIGAVKCINRQLIFYQSLIQFDGPLPKNITDLTGISTQMIQNEGKELREVLIEFLDFIQGYDLAGYNIGFDIKFLNEGLKKSGMPVLKNKTYDLMKAVKREKLFQKNYKLESSLISYGIHEAVPHRALEDAKLIYALSTKVNKFRA